MLNNYAQGFIIPGAILLNWSDDNDKTIDIVVSRDGDIAKIMPVGNGSGHMASFQILLDEKDIISLVEFMIEKFDSHNVLELSATVGGEVAKRLGEGKIANPKAASLESAIRKAYPGYLERMWDTQIVINDEPEEAA